MGANVAVQPLDSRVVTKCGFPIPIVRGIREFGFWNYFKHVGGFREGIMQLSEKLTLMDKARILRSLKETGCRPWDNFVKARSIKEVRDIGMKKLFDSLSEEEVMRLFSLFARAGGRCSWEESACKNEVMRLFSLFATPGEYRPREEPKNKYALRRTDANARWHRTEEEMNKIVYAGLDVAEWIKSERPNFPAETFRRMLFVLECKYLYASRHTPDREEVVKETTYHRIYETTESRAGERIAAVRNMFIVMAALGGIRESEIPKKLVEFEKNDKIENYVGKTWRVRGYYPAEDGGGPEGGFEW